MTIKIYFDGYCPESLLKGEKAEMRLNEDDFWESEATGLQIAVFPPFAAILSWRGKGKFRKSDYASNILGDLVMAGTQKESGFRPDENRILHNEMELGCYLKKVVEKREEIKEV